MKARRDDFTRGVNDQINKPVDSQEEAQTRWVISCLG